MVRVITQETFNSVVKENICELEMTAEEAVSDAIEQFEAQGVDLSNIVKSSEMAQGRDPLLICLNNLKDSLEESAASNAIMYQLRILREQCNRDLSRKVFAGKHGAYPSLLDVLDKYSDDKVLVSATLQTLSILMDGFPDLLDERGISLIINLLSISKDKDIIILVLKWCQKCCINHEMNRQEIFDNQIVEKLKALIDSGIPDLLPEICRTVRVFTLDDDVRVQVSNAHNHARVLATELLCPVTNLLTKHRAEKEIVTELLLTLSTLVVRNEFCAKVEEAGGLKFILDALTEFLEDEVITKNCLLLLKGLAQNDDVKFKIMQAGSSAPALLALEKHMKSVTVSIAGLSVITILALRSPGNSKALFEQGAAELILQIMKVHSTNAKVQRNGCWAIRNMVSRSRELCQPFLNLGAEEIINAVIRQHKQCEPDAKAALRDLGCKVELQEQWKGKGHGNVHN